MQTLLRRLVSGQKRRFQDGGFDLDLAYICPRVIAMGLPAAAGKEVLYRNPMQEIARFLQTYHQGHAKVYNLCSEHVYSPRQLSVAVQHYPHDDHQTPPLALVQQFCADAAAWLAADPANVVVVHCKAGKGRTGIMVCSLLLFLHKNAPDLANLSPAVAAAAAATAHACSNGSMAPVSGLATAQPSSSPALERNGSEQWHPWHFVPPVQLQHLEQPVRDILDLYAERRTHDGNGVTIKSQRRWVGYFWAVLSSSPCPVGLLPKPRAVWLRQVLISGLAPGTADSCVLLVEARPSGSLAPRASRICTRMAPRANAGGAAGLCMVPCAHAPMVQDDSCSISTGPLGDTLAFKMPAASMGLSTLPRHSNGAAAAPAAVRASSAAAANSKQGTSAPGTTADASVTAAMWGRCMCCCGAHDSSSCACWQDPAALPGAVPSGSAGTPGCQGDPSSATAAASGQAAAAAARAAPVDAAGGSWAGLAVDDAGGEAGCCVVEGDVRLVVMRGSTRLFYTWFNTAFLPQDGCYSLSRAQLDKPAKSLPAHLSLAVHFVDMQPTADDEGSAAAAQAGQQQQQQRQQPWPYGFQEPPLETTAKPCKEGKGSMLAAAAGAAGIKPRAHAAGNGGAAATQAAVRTDNLQLQRHTRSSSADAVDLSAAQAPAACAVHLTGQWELGREHADLHSLQQQQQLKGAGTAASHAPGPISSSAPASPQSRKLRSSGSWRQHLPAISSISTSALLWGSGANSTGTGTAAAQHMGPKLAKDMKQGSPGSWCSSAGLSWEWDWGTLTAAAAEDDAGAATAALPGSGTASRSSVDTTTSSVAGTAARVGSPILHGYSAQQAHGAAGAASPPHHSLLPLSRQRRSHSTPPQALPSNNLGSGSVRNSSSRAGSVPGTWTPPSIELPVMVKRPSGVDSLVAALLDPEHSAASSAATAAAAAAVAATGALLASEASSAAVAGRGTGEGRHRAQLRKGYSWHGSSWFAAIAGGGGSGSGGSAATAAGPASSPAGLQPKHSSGGRSHATNSHCATTARGSEGLDTAALTVASLDVDPLLLCESSVEVSAALLGSCDPVQSFMEALLGSTDAQHYRSHDSGHSNHSRSIGGGSNKVQHGLGCRCSSSSRSEPCSPMRCSKLPQLLPHVASSPLPQAPGAGEDSSAAAVGQGCRTAQHGTAQAASQQARLGLKDTGMLAAGARAAAGMPSKSASVGYTGSSGSLSSRHRRGRVPRADVARLLDLEQWAEDEAEGLDAGQAAAPAGAAAPVPAVAAAAAAVPRVRPASRTSSSSARGPQSSPASRGQTVFGAAAVGVHDASDAAAASDTGCLPAGGAVVSSSPSRADKPTAPATPASSRPHSDGSYRAPASRSRNSRSQGDEALVGLLAAGETAAPSCGAEAPAALQQWQQLERAWQKSWWV